MQALVAQGLGQVNAAASTPVQSAARDLPPPCRYSGFVTAFRRHLLAHRRSAAWLIVAALLMRMLIPTGYMLVASPAGIPTFAMCSGYGPLLPAAATDAASHDSHDGHAMTGAGKHHGQQHESAKEQPPCAFAGVTTAALVATDPLLLAIALFFILAAGFRLPVRAPVATSPFLRPPLRGPPATA